MRWQVIVTKVIAFWGLSLTFSMLLMADESKPLAGQIWDSSQGKFVKFEDILKTATDKTYIIVGERHGREAFLIGTLAEAGRYPRITL